MLIVLGVLVVAASVVGGYLMEGGVLAVLNQPAEFVIIGGAAAGSLLIGTPFAMLGHLLRQCRGLLSPVTTKKDYLELLSMMYQLFRVIQQSGVMALESHFDNPKASPILSKFPKFLDRHDASNFLSDSVKMLVLGGIAPHDLDLLMEGDLHAHHEEAVKPAGTLNKMADSLPGLGIVAAVLGVVITMGYIDGPPAEIGHKVGAALVGTFLGVLLSYGFVQPVATHLEHRAGEAYQYLQCIRVGLNAAHKGFAPITAIEFARRSLPSEVRPSMDEAEAGCRSFKLEPAAKAA